MTEIRTLLPQDISVVIPVKDNQAGIDRLLSSFFQTQKPEHYPGELIIIDNNSSVPLTVPEEFYRYGLDIQVDTCGKPGPAAARNSGAKMAGGKWLLFVDSDCIATESMVTGYLNLQEEAVGYQGLVGVLGNDYVSRYYESQEIHYPPPRPDSSPKYLVTANVLVKKNSFEQVDGFNEDFTMAGGEDIELAIRLAKVGQLSYARGSKIIHDFDDGVSGFVKRFLRYGKGNRLVREFHKANLLPLPSTAKNKSVFVNNFLVILQWLCLLLGYVLMSIELLGKTATIGEDRLSESPTTGTGENNEAEL